MEPDLLFVSAARRHIVTERACEGAPDLVAEILSPSNPAHDLDLKRELYARHAVPEYWILDPIRETVRKLTGPAVHQGLGEYATEDLYASGDTLDADVTPGRPVAVSDIFADPW